jgi:DNA polymerase/3'-5' exonuclease PolX
MIDKNEKLKKSNTSNEIFDLVGMGKKNSYNILAGGPRLSKTEG